MGDNRARRRIEWMASALHPKRMIASPTLSALRSLLSGSGATPPTPAPAAQPAAFSVPLGEVPGLSEVGGIAMVTPGQGEPVGVARVGRTSFVGFKLDGDALCEIGVELDEASGRLKIDGGVAYPWPLPS